MRRGIFGGSFDPPHLGHLIIAQRIAEQKHLDIVTWVPARTPPHKNPEYILEASYRLDMVRLAIADNPLFEVSEIEMNASQPPWTIFLLERFRKENPADELHLIIGGDSLAEFNTWRDYRKLWQLAQIDVAMRPGINISSVNDEIIDNVSIVETPQIAISSTEIREIVAKGGSLRYLVPEAVRDYIEENRLYLAR